MNGSVVDAGRVRRPNLLFDFWAVIQMIECLRSFLAGRAGWSLINGLRIVPGAFGLLEKAAVLHAGENGAQTVTKEPELVASL